VFDWIYTLYESDKHFGMTNVKFVINHFLCPCTVHYSKNQK